MWTAGALTAVGALLSSDVVAPGSDAPAIVAGSVSLRDVAIYNPPLLSPFSHAWVITSEGALEWTASAAITATALMGSLTLSSSAGAVSVNWQAPLNVTAFWTDTTDDCSAPIFDLSKQPPVPAHLFGALVISSNTSVTIEGSVTAANVGVYASTDVILGPTGVSIQALACKPSNGQGRGWYSPSGNVGGGASHATGGSEGASAGGTAPAGPLYNSDPVGTGTLSGGSGGGGPFPSSGTSGWGGGTVALAGGGTLLATSTALSSLTVDGTNGSTDGTKFVGGGSGGAILVAFSRLSTDNGGAALGNVVLNARGGASAGDTAAACSGAGAGGVVVFATSTVNGIPVPKSLDLAGGAANPSTTCGAGDIGESFQVNLPASPSRSHTSTKSSTASASSTPTSTTSPSRTATATQSSSVSASPGVLPTTSPAPSTTATATPSLSASVSASQSWSTTASPSPSPTPSATPTASPRAAPPPPAPPAAPPAWQTPAIASAAFAIGVLVAMGVLRVRAALGAARRAPTFAASSEAPLLADFAAPGALN